MLVRESDFICNPSNLKLKVYDEDPYEYNRSDDSLHCSASKEMKRNPFLIVRAKRDVGTVKQGRIYVMTPVNEEGKLIIWQNGVPSKQELKDFSLVIVDEEYRAKKKKPTVTLKEKLDEWGVPLETQRRLGKKSKTIEEFLYNFAQEYTPEMMDGQA